MSCTIVGASGDRRCDGCRKPVKATAWVVRETHCIGATTLNEYRQYIEKDAALERRFQPVMVDEPTVEDKISIERTAIKHEVYFWCKDCRQCLVSALFYLTVILLTVSSQIRQSTLWMKHVR